MYDFLKFFDEKVKTYPMHLEIYYSKIMNWCIQVDKKESYSNKATIVNVQSHDIELAFAQAHIKLKEWLLENEGDY